MMKVKCDEPDCPAEADAQRIIGRWPHQSAFGTPEGWEDDVANGFQFCPLHNDQEEGSAGSSVNDADDDPYGRRP